MVFATVTVLGTLGLLEGGARLVERWRPDTYDVYPNSPIVLDPVLHHRLRPRTRGYIRRAHFFGQTNAQGWEEAYDVQRTKPPNVYRIFYVGDSQVNALVAPGVKMVDIVERKLNRLYRGTGRRIEVINTGTSSYSTMIYYLLVKHDLLSYAPDLVVINVDMSDVPNDYSYKGSAVMDRSGVLVALDPKAEPFVTLTPFGPIERSRGAWAKAVLCQNSALARLVDGQARRVLPVPPPPKLRDLVTQVQDRSADWLRWDWTPEVEHNVAASMQYLGMTIDLLRAHGVRVFVTGVPPHGQFTGEYSDRPHRVLAETVARHGCLFLNSYEVLGPRVRGTPPARYYWSFDPTHFNERGNAAWARAQIGFLLEYRAQLLPPRAAELASGEPRARVVDE